MKSTNDRYGAIAIFIHWMSALLILGLLASGFTAASMVDDAAKAAVLRFHAVAGVVVLVLTLFRIAWWLFADTRPAMLSDQRVVRSAARTVQTLFYIVVLGMAASGLGMIVLSGAGEILFGGQAGSLPDFFRYLPRIPHGIGARLLVALLFFHVAGALYHHLIARDRTLARIGLGR